jgi:hypothetical protein
MADGAKILLVLFILVFAIVAIIFFPLLYIWAFNLLFGFSIPYTFKTWLAALLLAALFGPARLNTKS